MVKLRVLNVVRSLGVRMLLVVHTVLAYWLVTSTTGNNLYLLFLLLLLLLLAEAVYRIVKRKGHEGKWVCPCFFFYLLSALPAIWILELDRLDRYSEIYDKTVNSSTLQSLSEINGVSIPIQLSPDVWVSVIEQSLLVLVILGRWILPRGKLTRDQLSQLLFVYIGMAADNMELFELFEEPVIRRDMVLTYAILAIWSASLVQFSIVLTASKIPKKSGVAVHPMDTVPGYEERRKESACVMCLKKEIWSLLTTFCVQDGPFLAIRLYSMIHYKLLTYSIIFFTCKNILIILLLTYRLYVLCVGDTGEYDFENENDLEDKARDDKPHVTRSKNERVTVSDM